MSFVNQNHMLGVRKNSLSVNRGAAMKGNHSSATTSPPAGSPRSFFQYSLRKWTWRRPTTTSSGGGSRAH